MTRKVLMIAYIFPPLGGSGVQRTAKFASYLPDFGWKPFVVCGDDPEVFQAGEDSSLLAELPDAVRVRRLPFVSPLGLRKRFHSLLGHHQAGIAAGDKGKNPGRSESHGLLRRCLGLLSRPLAPFEFPPVDAGLYWALSVVPACLRIIETERIEIIFTTSFPYSDHLSGAILKRITGLPWVADFRDPWTQNAFAGNAGWRRRVDERVEKYVLTHADKVVGVTPTYTAGLRSLASARPAEVFITLENGYDRTDFCTRSAPLWRRDRGAKLLLGHIGKAYPGAVLPFFEALTHLSPEERQQIKLLFVGGLEHQEKAFLATHLPEIEAEIRPRTSHAEAVALMQKVDVLLLFLGSGCGWEGNYPGKLFEYMASGTPILMVGPDGEAARLVRLSGTGIFILADDPQAIACAVQGLAGNLPAFYQDHYHPDPAVLARYERRSQAGRLAAIFSELARWRAG